MTRIRRALVSLALPSLILVVAISGLALDQSPAVLKSLYEGHHWFQLRDAVSFTNSSELFRGAIFSAFNQRGDAEKSLLKAISVAPRSKDATAARELLIHLYMRSGKYSEATPLMADQIHAKQGESASKNDEGIFAKFVGLGDQTVVSRGEATLHYEMTDVGINAPVSINGDSASFLLDTDSNISVISESEARRLNLLIIHGNMPFSGVTGNANGGARVAVARELVIGNFRFNNVSFLVLNDDQEPFAELPAGKRGILGLPVILAFQTIRWNRNGKLDIGFAPAVIDLSHSNLCFDDEHLVAQVEFDGRKLEFVLDTGGADSEFWPQFGKEFASLISQSGKKESRSLTGYTGSKNIESVTLPEAHLKFGGFTGILRPAPVFTKPTVGASNWYYGRLSMDVLNQAHTVTIDFKAMTITLN